MVVDLLIVVLIVVAVGLVQLRRSSRPEAEPRSKRDNLSVFGRRVVVSVVIWLRCTSSATPSA